MASFDGGAPGYIVQNDAMMLWLAVGHFSLIPF